MKKAAKKRVGRPPGRKAPHRPVLSARVPQEDYARVALAAATSGRTTSEEAVWRIRQSFEWERAFDDVRTVVANANRVAGETIKAKLANELRRQGYTQVRGIDGAAAWFEPGVNAIKWIFANVDAESRIVLQEMLELAASRALEKSRSES